MFIELMFIKKFTIFCLNIIICSYTVLFCYNFFFIEYLSKIIYILFLSSYFLYFITSTNYDFTLNISKIFPHILVII